MVLQKAIDSYNKKINNTLPGRCCLTGSRCKYRTDSAERRIAIERQPYAFIARPYSADCKDMEDACKSIITMEVIIAQNYIPIVSSENNGEEIPTNNNMATIVARDLPFVGNGYCQICSLIQYSFFGVVELAHLNPNVMLELGLMNAFSKPVIITIEKRITTMSEIPFDISGYLVNPYNNNAELSRGLKTYVRTVKLILENASLI